MKKIIALIVILITNMTIAQGKVTFQAQIANRNGDVIKIKDNKGKVVKEITINENGVFKDSFDVTPNFYLMDDGVEYAQLFLKPGYDLFLKMDAKEFDESIKFSGEGSKENNFLAETTLLDEEMKPEEFLAADEELFKNMIAEKKAMDFDRLENSNLDAEFVTMQKENIEMSMKSLEDYYQQNMENKKLNNTKAPNFEYVNFNGAKTKLSDFKGKYVYIDVWATWCGPCRAEIPFLQKVEEKYKDKKITFVSISIDVDKDFQKWKTFVKEKNLGGTQLFADKNWTSDFIKSFNINSIPRFILIDPSGNVVDADAKRPSSTELIVQLDELLK
jgi:thiol-disulfide isomerase/thioredoxin